MSEGDREPFGWQSPTGWAWHDPAASPHGGWGPGWLDPGWPPPRRRRRLESTVLAALLVGCVAAGAVVGVELRGPAPGTGGAGGSVAQAPFRGAVSSTATSVASRVTPAIVDVTSTLADLSGQAAGTGMVITSSGEVLTNNHVIDGAGHIEVQVSGTGPTYSAHVVGTDATDDVALLQVDGASGLQTVPVGDSSTVAVGDHVVAIGNALGRSGPPAVTEGAVTGLDQEITASDANGSNTETLTGLIQFDAPIQPGDSGGPLSDSSGRVIGMDTAAQPAGRRRALAPSSVGFAIPINTAMSIVKQIEAGGGGSPKVQTGQRGILGVVVQDTGSGAGVTGVQTGGPADQAGISAGDTIVSVDGRDVTSTAALRAALAPHHPGDRVPVAWVDMSGQPHAATVQLAAGPPA